MEKVRTRQRRAAFCSRVSRCDLTPTADLVELTSRVLQGRAENDLIKAVEESGGRLKGSILRPGYFFPSKAYPQDTLNQRSLTLRVADKLLGPPLSLFYAAGVISVEQIGQFALEAARGKWEAKYGPARIFENTEMKDLLKSL